MEKFKKSLDYYSRKYNMEKCYGVYGLTNSSAIICLGIIYDNDDRLVVKFDDDRSHFTAKKITYDDNGELYINYFGMDLYLNEFMRID